MRLSLVLALAVVTFSIGACADDPPAPTDAELLAKSCAGERLDVCEPYAFAIMTAGAITPDMLRVGDLVADARVTASLTTCGTDSPAAHSVRVDALATVPGPDGGTSQRSFFLLEREDTDRDGEIDVTLPSPFDTGVPPSTSVTLRFTPRIDVTVTLPDGTPQVRSCNGASFEVPYTTGERYVVGVDGGV